MTSFQTVTYSKGSYEDIKTIKGLNITKIDAREYCILHSHLGYVQQEMDQLFEDLSIAVDFSNKVHSKGACKEYKTLDDVTFNQMSESLLNLTGIFAKYCDLHNPLINNTQKTGIFRRRSE